MAEALPVLSEFNEVMFWAKDRAQAATRYRHHRPEPALERAGFEVVVFRSDPTVHGTDYFRCHWAKKL